MCSLLKHHLFQGTVVLLDNKHNISSYKSTSVGYKFLKVLGLIIFKIMLTICYLCFNDGGGCGTCLLTLHCVDGGFLFADGYPFEPPKMQFATKVW